MKTSNLEKACSNVGLDYHSLKAETESNTNNLIKQIENNQMDQKLAGHHGVPLLVYKNQTFFGQDRFDDFKNCLFKMVCLKDESKYLPGWYKTSFNS